MARSKPRKRAAKDPSSGGEVAWTRAARQRIGVEPEPGDVKNVPAAALCADLSDLCRSWTGYPQAASKSQSWTEWRELRRRIARASPEALLAARARAEKLRASAEPALRAVLAYLFTSHPAWARADAEACLAATAVPVYAELLVGAIDDPDLSKRLITARLRVDERRDLTFAALEIVHALGARAEPLLETIFDVLEDDRLGRPKSDDSAKAYRSAEQQRRSTRRIPKLLEAMELIRTPEAAAFFAARLGRPATRRTAARYFRAAPGLAFRVLPRVAAGRNKAAGCARGLLAVLAGKYPDLAAAAVDRSRGKLLSFIGRTAMPRGRRPPEASPDELPQVLRDPVWRRESPRDVASMSLNIPNPVIPVDPAHSREAWLRAMPQVPPALVFSPRIAFTMATTWLRRIARRDTAEAWLVAFPEIATIGLIPWAVGTHYAERSDALQAIRFLQARDAEAVRRGAAFYDKEVGEVLAEALAGDPMLECPERAPQVRPRFLRFDDLPRPLLAGRERALPRRAVLYIVEMLIFSPRDFPYVGLAQVKPACDQASLDAFAWAMYEAWLATGAPSRHRWPMRALGELGGDEVVRRLVPLIARWPIERAVARARGGVHALGRIGTDLAVTHLGSIAELSRFPAVRAEARAALDVAARSRGLRRDELADRTVPHLDVDGTMVIDYGEISVRAGFDEHLEPFVRDEGGAVLHALPRPRSPSAAARAAEAAWLTRRSDVAEVVAAQARRLERRMATRWAWSTETFLTWVVPHRLMAKLLRGLVLDLVRTTDGEESATLFRVTEDGSFADAEDAPVSLDGATRVAIPHPLQMEHEALLAWGTLFADYEILQPFPQLGRAVYTLTEVELDETELARFSGTKVATKKLLDLLVHGWEHVPCIDQPFDYFVKRVDGSFDVRLEVRPGIDLRHPRSTPAQTLGPLCLFQRDRPVPLRGLHPITRSELVLELAQLAE